MKKSLTTQLRKQTDSYILRGIQRLLATDQKRKADFLIYLNEVDDRKLYAEAGYSSLFGWLTEVHRMSESTALKRIQVARLAKKFPFLYEEISKGDFSLSVLSRLSHFVVNRNAPLLFNAARGKSVRAVETMLADRFPKEEVEELLNKPVSPLGLDRHKVQFTADTEFVTDLEKARALLSHRFPQGRMNDVLGLALKKLVQELQRPVKVPPADTIYIARGIQMPPDNSQPSSTNEIPRGIQASRHIPNAIRRQVEQRDGYRCQQPRPDGTLCGETHFLEVDHITPFAVGGTHKPENLRLLCWAHNALRAERQFGKRRATKPES